MRKFLLALLFRPTLVLGLITQLSSSLEPTKVLIPGLPNEISGFKIFPLCKGRLKEISLVSKNWKNSSDELTTEYKGKGAFPIELLTSFSNMTSLVLHCHMQITNADLEHFTKLNCLSIVGPSVINDAVFDHLTGLTKLTLWGNNSIPNKCLWKLPKLTHLELKQYSQITNRGLSRLTNLTHLYVSDPSREKFISATFTPLTNLTSLTLRFCSKVGNNALKSLTNLRNLCLNDPHRITNSGLSKLSNLTSLEINGSENDFTLKALLPLKHLTYLMLNTTYFENEELKKIIRKVQNEGRSNLRLCDKT